MMRKKTINILNIFVLRDDEKHDILYTVADNLL